MSDDHDQLSLVDIHALMLSALALKPGEHYAGTVLNDDGTIKHHLVLMVERPDGRMTWADAKAWAESIGGVLPTRQEAALLCANCRAHVEGSWHWTSEPHEDDASLAWGCYFYYGYVDLRHKSFQGRARAVCRLIP